MKKIIYILLLLLPAVMMAQEACQNQSTDYNVNGTAGASTTVGSTYAWSVTTGGFTGTISGNPAAATLDDNGISIDWGTTPAGTYTLQVIETSADGCVGTPQTIDIDIIIPGSLISIASTPVCAGIDGSFTITTQPDAVVTYNLDGAAAQTATADNSGVITVPVTAPTANVVLTVTSINNGVCDTAITASNTNTLTITAAPVEPTVSVTTPVCLGDDATISFTGGEAGATIAYTTNGTAATLALDGSGNGSVTYTPVAAGTDTINIASITSTGGCAATINEDYVITVNPAPVVPTLTADPTSACQGNDVDFTITGTVGDVVTYTTDGGTTTQTATITNAGTAVVTLTNLQSDTTMELTNVDNGNCDTDINVPVTVNVSTGPTEPTLTVSTPICSGDDAVFIVENGVVGQTIEYSINNGTLQTGTLVMGTNGGSLNISVNGATADQTIVISLVAVGSCTAVINLTETIVVNPVPVTSPIGF